MNAKIANWAHIRREVLVCGVFNALLNGVGAWFLLRSGPALHWSAEPSFALDMMATGLLLPLITALIVIPLQRGQLKRGKLQFIRLGDASVIQSLADCFPSSTWKSALLFGLVGVTIIAPLSLLVFHVLGITQASPSAYAIFKGAWTGVIAGVLVIPMVLIALRESP